MKGQKLTYIKKNYILGQKRKKKKLGLSLRTKKGLFWVKKKRDISGQKKQAGAELKKKKKFFWAKNLEKK